MRNLGLSVAFAALLTAPAVAEPIGFVSGGVGANLHHSEYSEAFPGPLVQAQASGIYALTPTLTAQGDIAFEYVRHHVINGAGEIVDHRFNLDGTVHVFHRDPNTYLIGAFAQMTGDKVNRTIDGNPNTYGSMTGFAGLEAQWYLDNVTFYGQAGFARDAYSYNIVQSGIFATAEVRYFINPDLKLGLHASAVSLVEEDDLQTRSSTFGIGIGAEYRLPDSQFSIFGKADIFSTYYDDMHVLDDKRVLVGLKYNFGSDTLLSADRNGASLNPVQSPLYAD